MLHVCAIDGRDAFVIAMPACKLNPAGFRKFVPTTYLSETSRRISDSSTDKVFLNVELCERLIKKTPRLYVADRRTNIYVLKGLISSEILPRVIKFPSRNLNAVNFKSQKTPRLLRLINSQFFNVINK